MRNVAFWMNATINVCLVALMCGLTPLAVGLVHTLAYGRVHFTKLFSGLDAFLTYAFKWHPYQNFFKWEPLALLGWLWLAYVIGVLGRATFRHHIQRKETYEERSTYASHGSARWQTEKEMKQNYYRKGEQGFIIGDVKHRVFQVEKQYAMIPNNGATNLNLIAFGSPGSEKTTGLVFPNIIHTAKNLGYSIVATDPKGELYRETADWVQQHGYEVRIIDFLHLLRGSRINFLDYVFDDTDLLKIADSFISGANAVKNSKGSSDPIWDEGETSLLAALIGFVKHVYRDTPEKQTFATISSILSTEFRDPKKYPTLFEYYSVTGTAERLFNNFLLAKDKVRDNILFGLATKLTLFSVPSVAYLTGISDFDIKELGRRKVALYLMVSDSERTYSPLVTVFWSIFFNSIYHLRLTEPNAQTPIFCAMDELANIGKISGLQEKLGTMRSRHLYPMMIWQSLPQLKDRYPNHAWEDILSMCDTRLLLSANDDTTQAFFSQQLGRTTVEVQGLSQQMQREELTYRSQSESASYTGRPLLFPSEIGTLPNDQIIMIQKGKNPVKMRKLQYQYWKKKVCEEKPYNSIPLLPHLEQQGAINPDNRTTISKKEINIDF